VYYHSLLYNLLIEVSCLEPMSKRFFRPLPPSATRSALLSSRSDHLFRELLYDFFTVANRLEQVRRYLGSRIGLTGPQYTLMMAVAELQGSSGASVGRVADYLHVTGTFVTAESRKLSKKGFVSKRPDSRDGRVSRLSISPKGWLALESLFPELQQINDGFFDLASGEEFVNLHRVLQRMVESSRRTLSLIQTRSEKAGGRT
jgi:DNA-binding MarR family transcriptional regulator